MAEDQEEGQGLTEEEKENLEASLDDTGNEDASAAPSGLKGKIQAILSNKKLLMIFGGGTILLILAIGAGFYFINSESEEEAPVKKEKAEEEITEEEEKDAVEIEKVNIYKLDPFFLPIRENGKETGKFISLSANLLLSNSALHKEIERVLPLLRKKIYEILRRKRSSDFKLQKSNIKERIKKEIIMASNTLLLTGTGTVTDVLFSSFIIK
ncbi:MAG: flagellar basal body-associated FliL family protein [Nitrospinota bacterium]|nr:flagellar basal body-associated FliL family protein [Nitrospinota bacterium]